MDFDRTGGSRVTDRAQKVATLLKRRRRELVDASNRWTSEVHAVLDSLEQLAKERFGPTYATATFLQVEMQRDLLDYMPYPANLSNLEDPADLNSREPERVRDEVMAIVRFVEWLLFRKQSVSAREIAQIFDSTSLNEQTVSYCRLLRAIESDVRAISDLAELSAAGPDDDAPLSSAHLKLV